MATLRIVEQMLTLINQSHHWAHKKKKKEKTAPEIKRLKTTPTKTVNFINRNSANSLEIT